MRYSEFERILSQPRLSRYKTACAGNTRKAMTLYRENLRLSQELLTMISCFEVALRNAVNQQCLALGTDWLKDAAQPGGIFDNARTQLSKKEINVAVSKLGAGYTHSKLVAELGFGFWRYMFATRQFQATSMVLNDVFPAKPRSTPAVAYNQTFIFNELADVNKLRNRIAHHEPVCFQIGQPYKSTAYARQHYALIKRLFQWMAIEEDALLYGLDHVTAICDKIDQL